MKIINIYLIMPFVFTSMDILATEEPLLPHSDLGIVTRNAPRGIQHSPKQTTIQPHQSLHSTGEASLNKTNPSPLLTLTEKYTAAGLSLFEAVSKAKRELQEASETHLEKELRTLGCVQWGDINEITPEIMATVRALHRPEMGEFILKPGLTVIYLNEIK